MTDLVLTAPGRLDVRSQPPPPRLDGADDVLVQVDRVTLCGSDYGLFSGGYGGPSSYPLRFGHEWSGWVLDAGRDARHLIGRAVTGDCSRWCGGCRQCGTDRNRCLHIEKFGLTVDGFSVRRRTVHRRHLYPDEYGLSPGTLALTEFFAVVHRGLRLIPGLGPTTPALVIGAGALGLAAHALLTRRFGVGAVTLLEADPAKRALVSARLGVEVGAAPSTAELDAIRGYRAVAEHARYPVVVECSGSADGMNTALALADFGGTVLWLGLAASSVLRPDLVVTKGLTVRGSIGGTGDFPAALRFLADHEPLAASLVTHRFPAREAERALAVPPEQRAARIKAQLEFDGDD